MHDIVAFAVQWRCRNTYVWYKEFDNGLQEFAKRLQQEEYEAKKRRQASQQQQQQEPEDDAVSSSTYTVCHSGHPRF